MAFEVRKAIFEVKSDALRLRYQHGFELPIRRVRSLEGIDQQN
jgi:hypothetical protein